MCSFVVGKMKELPSCCLKVKVGIGKQKRPKAEAGTAATTRQAGVGWRKESSALGRAHPSFGNNRPGAGRARRRVPRGALWEGRPLRPRCHLSSSCRCGLVVGGGLGGGRRPQGAAQSQPADGSPRPGLRRTAIPRPESEARAAGRARGPRPAVRAPPGSMGRSRSRSSSRSKHAKSSKHNKKRSRSRSRSRDKERVRKRSKSRESKRNRRRESRSRSRSANTAVSRRDRDRERASSPPDRIDIFGRTVSKRSSLDEKQKREEEEKKAEFERQRKIRQQEIEEKLIEEETARRVEELVAKRVEEELEKRKDEIEREVLRRVEEAKRIMEKQLLEELERQRQAELAAQKAREVTLGRLESRDSPWQNFQCPVCFLLSSERDGIQTNSFLI